MINLAEPFVRRQVATTLLAIGLVLIGLAAYRALPVASMPTVDFPFMVRYRTMNEMLVSNFLRTCQI